MGIAKDTPLDSNLRESFLKQLRHHMKGWEEKVHELFYTQEFNEGLQLLKSDPVYSRFGFDIPEFEIVRRIGRMSISIGRRIGEIYDKVPRLMAQAKFGLTKEIVAQKIPTASSGSGLEMDILLPYEKFDDHGEVRRVRELVSSLDNSGFPSGSKGIGIEIRFNFNPNDSSRLRKDVELGKALQDNGFLPIYLIFTENSPRDEAILRLSRSGWNFIIGNEAKQFMHHLFEADFTTILDEPTISKEIKSYSKKLMRSIFTSPAYKTIQQ